MERIARFEKVTFEQYAGDFRAMLPHIEITDEELRQEYEAIKLPVRATSGSAGYDFFLPHPFHFEVMHNTFFPTGIRCHMQPGWVLQLHPKSGLGTRNGTTLLNTIGIVDEDYFFAQNQGHILIGLRVKKALDLNAGDKIVQGIFTQYGITVDDDVDGMRTGGFGSTGKN